MLQHIYSRNEQLINLHARNQCNHCVNDETDLNMAHTSMTKRRMKATVILVDVLSGRSVLDMEQGKDWEIIS